MKPVTIALLINGDIRKMLKTLRVNPRKTSREKKNHTKEELN